MFRTHTSVMIVVLFSVAIATINFANAEPKKKYYKITPSKDGVLLTKQQKKEIATLKAKKPKPERPDLPPLDPLLPDKPPKQPPGSGDGISWADYVCGRDEEPNEAHCEADCAARGQCKFSCFMHEYPPDSGKCATTGLCTNCPESGPAPDPEETEGDDPPD